VKQLPIDRQKNRPPANLLVLNDKSSEFDWLGRHARSHGAVYFASTLEKAITLLQVIDFNVLVTSSSFAAYSSLKGLFRKTTSIIITGRPDDDIHGLILGWPPNRYLDAFTISEGDRSAAAYQRILLTAIEHSLLVHEVENLNFALEKNLLDFSDTQIQINDIKATVQNSVVREMEKRLAMESEYNQLKKEKQKTEHILKKLYVANDVTAFLDIFHDIREIVAAESISFYIMDENETLGKYLKPLVWDGTFLSHPDFAKHVVLVDSRDFASTAARHGRTINLHELAGDERMSHRYIDQLDSPLRSIIAAPIIHAKQTIGVLEVYNKYSGDTPAETGFFQEDEKVLKKLCEHIAIAINKLNLIRYDALTGLLRPEPFLEKVLQKLRSKSKRQLEEDSYALVMGDVDWFKNYNDRNGHEAGNRLLRELATILNASIREGDLLCRYGGEEFLFFLSSVHDSEEAASVTDRIRKNVAEHYFEEQEYQPHKNLTMSFGITMLPQDRIRALHPINRFNLKKIITEADSALSEAKQKNGGIHLSAKNKICVYYANQETDHPSDLIKTYKNVPGHERRKQKRHFINTAIIYRLHRGNMVTKTINLSTGGLKISTPSRLPAEEILELILVLGNKACQCRGKVVYSEKNNPNLPYYHSGLKFTDLTLKDRSAMEEYFTSLTTKSTGFSQ